MPYKDGRPAYPDSGYVEPTIPEESATESEDSGLGGGSDTSADAAVITTESAVTESTQIPKAPETGAQTYPSEVCSREISLPWWVISLILAGNVLLIWWFTPNRQKLHKNPKKS